jgi:site-specific DNA-methyltransferase (adenine-specific)
MKDIKEFENRIICGDCLEIMGDLPDESIDLILTDPPYSSGGQFRGDRTNTTNQKYVQTDSENTCRYNFEGDNKDQRSQLMWSIVWLSRAFRKVKPGGVVMIFTDWRMLPTMTDAIQCGGWVWRNLITWWKPGIRMQRGRFSLSAEYIIYGSKGIPIEGECSPQNVLSFAPVSGEDKLHIAEKPVELMEVLLSITTKAATVLDPFAGSGSVLLASKRTNRKYVGIEINPDYCHIVEQRLNNIPCRIDCYSK